MGGANGAPVYPDATRTATPTRTVYASEENPMNGSTHRAPPAARSGGRKSLALLVAVLLVGGTLYVSPYGEEM